jgi:3',5'-cyclic-AMP phosphodiesterase
MTTLNFAQISDIHISTLGDHHEVLSGQSAGFLADIVSRLNQRENLDFVLITGDLLDTAHPSELEQFEQAIQALKAPYYVIPGNHDRRGLEQPTGLTRHQFAQRFNPQVAARPSEEVYQAAYWSISLTPEIQLIGLDSIRDADWGGIVDEAQLAWLEEQLLGHADKLIIVTVHHPLHLLAPIDEIPEWRFFVCDNGAQVLSLLDRHPQVKIVLTGHHHMSKVDKLNGRLHISTPAIAGYPCAYRTFQLAQQGEGWRLSWQTHPATDPETIAKARHLMQTGWQEFVGFEADFVSEYVRLSLGSDEDRQGMAIL